ncbi:hypothetical protein V496_10179 [Pseudogymnoascus sp. VKM F-4515 (FW-2607)]|nr:hypothetical protein V496_10179 [Pseudogymnoascus sp. VKM F-4515 (FW-2607)]KFY95445.1 hypothetical protein V498_03363 [Pseudogymnoascus sp. VKM F-4517 (FW-2822)]
MSSTHAAEVSSVVNNGTFRSEESGKKLTFVLGGQYIAWTTVFTKPLLVWETETSYPRYYIPVASLHGGIDRDNRGGPASVVTVEQVNGKDGSPHAMIESMTVGAKKTTWARFVEGPLKGYIRFDLSELDAWFENGAIANAIKNPYKRIDTHTVNHKIVIKVDGEVVAQSKVAVVLNETRAKEVYYLPATSILDWGKVEKSDLKTICPYKGEAWYLSLTVRGEKYENLIWYYPYPTHESSAVEGLISFYNKDGVDILVDGLKV